MAKKSTENKTQATGASVDEFFKGIADPQQQADSKTIDRLMRKHTGEKPAMWGAAMVGYGAYAYQYPTGRVGTWFPVGFSPRKGNMTLYFCGVLEELQTQLSKLGKHATGKGCLYIKNLADVDAGVLEGLIEAAVGKIKKSRPMGITALNLGEVKEIGLEPAKPAKQETSAGQKTKTSKPSTAKKMVKKTVKKITKKTTKKTTKK